MFWRTASGPDAEVGAIARPPLFPDGGGQAHRHGPRRLRDGRIMTSARRTHPGEQEGGLAVPAMYPRPGNAGTPARFCVYARDDPGANSSLRGEWFETTGISLKIGCSGFLGIAPVTKALRGAEPQTAAHDSGLPAGGRQIERVLTRGQSNIRG